MNVPTFIDEKMVDENGHLTPSWRSRLDELFSYIQTNFSNQGLVTPNVAAQTVAELSKSGDGTLVYSTDSSNPANNKLKVKINGTFKTIQTL